MQQDYSHVPIDFDVMQPYSNEKIEVLHQRIMQEYHLPEPEYQKILSNILDQLFRQEKNIAKVVNIIGLIKPQLKEHLEAKEKYQQIFRR